MGILLYDQTKGVCGGGGGGGESYFCGSIPEFFLRFQDLLMNPFQEGNTVFPMKNYNKCPWTQPSYLVFVRCLMLLKIWVQCSKLRVHPAPSVHILAAGCMDFKPSAPGVCMYIQHYEYLCIDMCTLKDSGVHGFVYSVRN